MAWMMWTAPTAMFFIAIGAMLCVMTIVELRRPTVLRRGLLPVPTTRGDRLFISLLAAGFVHLGWLALTDLPVIWASGLALGLGVGIMARG